MVPRFALGEPRVRNARREEGSRMMGCRADEHAFDRPTAERTGHRLRRLAYAIAVLAGVLVVSEGTGAAAHDAAAAAATPDFGPSVKVFDPSMSTSQIKATVDAVAAQQVSNQFGTQRDALLFMPGTYGSAADPLNFQVGYYTEVAGLVSSPNDVVSNGTVINGSQQQYLVRNSDLDGWTNGVWNQVFAGVLGAPAPSFPSPPYTTLATNPELREKPFLYVDSHDHFNVYVPDVRFNATGTTWQNGQTPGHSISIDDFFIAKPSDSVQAINNALARGQNLLFTPGIYDVDQTIRVKRPDTVVLGLGMATLNAENGVVPMSVADVKGVEISGLIFDAGPVSSPVLLQVGTREAANDQAREHNDWSDPNDPSALHDVFFRIGGAHLGKATVSLEVNADNTILDDIWAWRADHGSGVGWTSNTADSGLVVNGDNVVATGLFAEHYQRYDVVWNGE